MLEDGKTYKVTIEFTVKGTMKETVADTAITDAIRNDLDCFVDNISEYEEVENNGPYGFASRD